MKRSLWIVLALVLLGAALYRPAKAIAQGGFMAGMLSGLTHQVAIPAYLKSCNYTATTVANSCHTGPTVLGCVIINTAGAASSTIKLYDTAANAWAGGINGAWPNNTPAPAYLVRTIDATKVGSQFCYGDLFKGGITVVIASGGAAPDVSITYQGQ